VKKRFVVALKSHTPAQNKEFSNYIKSKGYGWWSWIDGVWLLVDVNGKCTAASLRSALTGFYPGVYLIVLEILPGEDTWAGFGPTGDKDMFAWVRRNWN